MAAPEAKAEAAIVPVPRANAALIGHEPAERELRHLFDAGRLPHALLITGPRGIGKATLAFRLARFVLARSSDDSAASDGLFGDVAAADTGSLAVPEESGHSAGWLRADMPIC